MNTLAFNINKAIAITGACALITTLGLSGCTQTLPGKGADLVLLNGKIDTQNSDSPWASAIAINGKRISYVGENQYAQTLIGQNTIVIDLDGQVVLPGFIDTHAHPVMAAGMSDGLQLSLDAQPDELLATIDDYVKDNPHTQGIIGFGFSAAVFGLQGPNKELLDAIEPNRPVILVDEGGHSAWVNSKALELAGIDRNTPDPVPGTHYFQRDSDGNPTGWCLEAMTFFPMIAKLQLVDTQKIITGSSDLFALFSAFGITTVYDAGFSSFADTAYEAVDQLAKEDKLPFRLVTSHMIQSPAHLVDAIDKLSAYQQRYSSELVMPRVMKIHNDGTKEARTAGQFEAYADNPDNFGSLLLEGKLLYDFVQDVDKAGFDIHIHAIGDKAVHEALNAFEQAKAANPDSSNRYSIAHTELVIDKDLTRFAANNVIAQTTPYWFEPHGEAALGKERANKLFRFRQILDSGAKVTFGSDFPATGSLIGLSPIINMEMGQTRRFPQSDKTSSAGPQKTLTLEEMIRGYTIDAAYQLNMETDIGSLEQGKLADLVVINKNVFELDEDQIHTAKVAMTMMNGEIVYQRNWKSYLVEWALDL
ncbi:amidohydrolase [Maricurvus nonylphenolicus]|uniref:amidohydrolase n=1 Tax=Maricurvus nonylphenolicus TaxID=1008307 RepID=UPI0036F2FFB5